MAQIVVGGLDSVSRSLDTFFLQRWLAVCTAFYSVLILSPLFNCVVLARSNDNNSVPPPVLATRLEDDVVHAIKARSSALSNTSFSSLQDLRSDNNYVVDNDNRTSTRYSDPIRFFNRWPISFKTSNNSYRARKTSHKSSPSPNLQKIFILSAKATSNQGDGVTNMKTVDDFKEDIIDSTVKYNKKTIKAKDEDAIPSEKVKDHSKGKDDIKKIIVSDSSDEKNIKHDSENQLKDEPKVDESSKIKINKKAVEGEDIDKDDTKEILKKSDLQDADSKILNKSETVPQGEALFNDNEKEIKTEKVTQKENEEKGEVVTEETIKESSETETDQVKKELKETKEDIEDANKGKKEEVEDAESKDTPEEKSDETGEAEDKEDKEIITSEEVNESEPVEKEKKKKDKKKPEEAEKSDDKADDTLETYSQFTQRVSAEKNKNDVNTNGHGTNGHKGSKVKGKNYASPDCGAKLVTANPEATHSSKVIHPSKDEYMLNKCRDKIWFVIELCESIRPHKFEIANFELFSNLPKDIQVFGSHRYPSRDWTSFGKFKGQEANRGIQSFQVATEDFFKYIKVEVTSHYGSEFYCPISTFQIYGLSEFEVIDTIEDSSDDDIVDSADEEEEITSKKTKEEGKQSVIPAVIKNMVTGVFDLIKRGYRPATSSIEPVDNCYSLLPKFAIENDTCPMATTLNFILSCFKMEYEALLLQPFVSSTVRNTTFCRQLALTMCSEPEVNDSLVYDTTCNDSYVCVMLSPKHVLAMCFMQDPQIMEKGISCNSERAHLDNYSTTSDIPTNSLPSYVKNAVINTSTITDSSGDSNKEVDDIKTSDIASEITLPIEENDEAKAISDDKLPSESSGAVETIKSPKESKSKSSNKNKDKASKDKSTKKTEPDAVSQTPPLEENIEIEEPSDLGGADIVELPSPPSSTEEASPGSTNLPSSSPPAAEVKIPITPTNKESVVVRLSNKIKALEYNVTISSQYLEELSRRYKRQMEEMQKQFNLTIAALNDTSRQAYERDQHHRQDIDELKDQLSNVSTILQKLVDERESLANTVVEQHVFLMIIEVVVLCIVFSICSRRRNNYTSSRYGEPRRNRTPSEENATLPMDQDSNQNVDNHGRIRVRRRSVDSITSERNSRLRQRRPSEEALNISGTYQDLLIIEPTLPIMVDSIERKKKRKSSAGTLKRSKSNASITDKTNSSRKAKRIEKLNMSSAGVLFCGEELSSPLPTPEYAPDTPDGQLMHEQSYRVEHVIPVENCRCHHTRSMVNVLDLEGSFVGEDSFSNAYSNMCSNCDNVQNEEIRLIKSSSFSVSEKIKSPPDKLKKIKKIKKAKIKEPIDNYKDSPQSQLTFSNYSKNYYYPKSNGICYNSPIETYGSYYYNGHNNTSVHFSEMPPDHCDHTYSQRPDIVYNGDYLNGVEDYSHYSHNEFSPDKIPSTYSVTEKKKVSPKVKSKVKLRSDNWEWYSSQHAGGSSSETVSTCSDSSGKNRKIKKEEIVNNDSDKVVEKKVKKKKRSKIQNPVLFEEETPLKSEP